jgi:hypothetical protein
MRSWIQTRTFALTLALVASACASTPPPPPNAAPPLAATEHAGTPGVPHSDVIEAAEAATISSEAVERGGSIMRVRYRYRHTAVLTEDVVGYSITVSGVQAPAGAPGYYAGTFVTSGGYQAPRAADMWCFLPNVVGGRRENICLLRSSPALAAIAPTRMNPYLWTQFSPATGSFDYVNAPVFERRDVEIPLDLILEYRFERWTTNGVRLVEYAVGRRVQALGAPIDSDGVAILRTIAGDFALTRDASDSARAVVRRIPAE